MLDICKIRILFNICQKESYYGLLGCIVVTIMSFSVCFFFNSFYPFQEIDVPHNTNPLLNKKFLTHYNIKLIKFFSPPPPHFGRRYACHNISKLADSQTNNNSPWLQNFAKTFIKGPISQKILGKGFKGNRKY